MFGKCWVNMKTPSWLQAFSWPLKFSMWFSEREIALTTNPYFFKKNCYSMQDSSLPQQHSLGDVTHITFGFLSCNTRFCSSLHQLAPPPSTPHSLLIFLKVFLKCWPLSGFYISVWNALLTIIWLTYTHLQGLGQGWVHPGRLSWNQYVSYYL